MNDFPLEGFPGNIAWHDGDRERLDLGRGGGGGGGGCIRKDLRREKSPKRSHFKLLTRTPSPHPSLRKNVPLSLLHYVSWGNGLGGFALPPANIQ